MTSLGGHSIVEIELANANLGMKLHEIWISSKSNMKVMMIKIIASHHGHLQGGCLPLLKLFVFAFPLLSRATTKKYVASDTTEGMILLQVYFNIFYFLTFILY
jgi:hypothetical protein